MKSRKAKKKRNKIILVVVSIIILGIGTLTLLQKYDYIDLKFICTNYAFDVCTSTTTNEIYCPKYEDVYYSNNCDKCGSTTVDRYTDTWTISSLPWCCPTTCDSCLVVGGSRFDGGSCTNSYLGQLVDCIESTTTCKSCTVNEYVGEYVCDTETICSRWEARQNSIVPSGAINVRCVDGFESCGNGICEPEYDETETSCAADCFIKICNPGEKKCENSYEYSCAPSGANWEQIKVCEYGCDGISCCVQEWTAITDWSPCIDGIESQIMSDGCGTERTDERTCESPGIIIPDNWINYLLIGFVILLFGGIIFMSIKVKK